MSPPKKAPLSGITLTIRIRAGPVQGSDTSPNIKPKSAAPIKPVYWGRLVLRDRKLEMKKIHEMQTQKDAYSCDHVNHILRL